MVCQGEVKHLRSYDAVTLIQLDGFGGFAECGWVLAGEV